MKKQDLLPIPLHLLLALPYLSDTEAGKLFKAIYACRIGQPPEELDPKMEMILQKVKESMDEITEHQQRISMARSSAGKQGGRPKDTESKDKPKPKKKKKVEEQLHLIDPEYTAFIDYVSKNCTYLYSHMQMPAEGDFAALKEKWPLAHLKKVTSSLENDKVYRDKYINLATTLNEWCSRQPQDPEPEPAVTPATEPQQKHDCTVKTDEDKAKANYIKMLKKQAAKGDQRAIEELKNL